MRMGGNRSLSALPVSPGYLRGVLVAVVGGALLLALLALVRVLRAYDHGPDSQIDLVGTVAVVATLLVAILGLIGPPLRRGPGASGRGLGRVGAAVAGVAIAFGVFLVAWASTPPIAFGRGVYGVGYGFDGEVYGRMAEGFIPFRLNVAAPFCYRPVVPLLARYSGLDTLTAFKLIDVLSYAACCLLAYRLARRCGAGRTAALLALYGVAALKFGLKFWLYYPAQVDAAALALTFAILLAILTDRHILYAILLTLAVGVRENLVVLIGFHVVYQFGRPLPRARRWRLLGLQLVPLAMFVLIRWRPLYLVDTGSVPLRDVLNYYVRDFLGSPARLGNTIMGCLNSLGFLPLLAVVHARHMWRGLRACPAWTYFGLVTAGLSIAGGADVDRFAVWLAPLGVAACAWISRRVRSRLSTWAWVHWMLLYAVAMNLPIYWFPHESFYRTRWAYTSGDVGFLWLSANAYVLLLAAAVWLVYQHGARPLDDRLGQSLRIPQAAVESRERRAGTGAR